MIDLKDIQRQLRANADGIRALLETISDEQARWQPNPETWSMQQAMEHMYNEERIDFRPHLREMFHDPPLPWGGLDQGGYVKVKSCQQALEDFLKERADSLAWLAALDSPDWDFEVRVKFGPEEEEFALKAGDVLVSWVAHDFLHIRQMNELLFAWNQRQAAPYSVQYAGGW